MTALSRLIVGTYRHLSGKLTIEVGIYFGNKLKMFLFKFLD